MPWAPRYSKGEVRQAVADADTVAEALRRLGLRPAGHNARTLRRLIEHYGVSDRHLDGGRSRHPAPPRRAKPLKEILVVDSTYHRGHLKERLYEEGVKARECELCGQGEQWRGRHIALILDHINGVPTDNRLENLRIVCPNCAATLDTHCGRKNRLSRAPQPCARCETSFIPKYASQRYCSRACAVRHGNRNRRPRPDTRKVTRPTRAQLLADLATMSMLAVGRKYGVSDNAVRKWLAAYGRDAAGGPAGAEEAA